MDVKIGAVVVGERRRDVDPRELRVDPCDGRFRVRFGEPEQGLDHRSNALGDPIDRRRGRTGGTAEAVVMEQGANLDVLTIGRGGVGQRVDEVDQRLDREADLGVVPRCDVHDASVSPLGDVRY